MTNNDLFYVCALIEYTARATKNHHRVIVGAMGKDGLNKQLKDAPMNHCLSFEQVSEEIVEWYHIPEGDFDFVSNAKYSVPSFQDIGKLYAIIIELAGGKEHPAEVAYDVLTSFLPDEISRFNTDMYYQNPDYLMWCYREGRVLEG